jgi:hypothetical protein
LRAASDINRIRRHLPALGAFALNADRLAHSPASSVGVGEGGAGNGIQ